MNGEKSLCCLFVAFAATHGFGWPNHDFVAASGANISFARCAGETIAARAIQHCFIPRLSAMGAGNRFMILKFYIRWN